MRPSASRVTTDQAWSGCSVTVLDRPSLSNGLYAPGGIVSLSSPESHLVYRLPAPAPDGRTELLLSPIQLLERLARFVPPPRVHRHRYHGVLAPNSKLRTAVTHIGRPEAPTPGAQLLHPISPASSRTPSIDAEPARPTNAARIRWAVLLARIYEVLPLLCPACGGHMKILAFITDPPVVFAILSHLELPNEPPLSSPARGPHQGDLLLDQTRPRPSIPPGPSPIPDLCSTRR